MPVHHRAEEAIEAYVVAAGLEDGRAPLFQSADRSGRLSGRPLGRRAVLAMIKRRAVTSALPATTCCHTFRAMDHGVPVRTGGRSSTRSGSPGHASPKATKLYDRTADAVSLDEIERMVI